MVTCRRTDRPAMTIAVDLGRKATKQTNKTAQDTETISLKKNSKKLTLGL